MDPDKACKKQDTQTRRRPGQSSEERANGAAMAIGVSPFLVRENPNSKLLEEYSPRKVRSEEKPSRREDLERMHHDHKSDLQGNSILIAMASNLLAMASNPIPMPCNLLAMASNPIAMTSNLLAMASTPIAMASNLLAMPPT